jgi:hypothetical protein
VSACEPKGLCGSWLRRLQGNCRLLPSRGAASAAARGGPRILPTGVCGDTEPREIHSLRASRRPDGHASGLGDMCARVSLSQVPRTEPFSQQQDHGEGDPLLSPVSRLGDKEMWSLSPRHGSLRGIRGGVQETGGTNGAS